MTHRNLLIVVLFVLFAACDTSSSRRGARMGDLDTSTLITLERALEIARGEVPEGFPVEAELELEDSDEDEPPAWEVELFVKGDNQLVEVEVHAQTGEVLEIEVEGDRHRHHDDDRDDD